MLHKLSHIDKLAAANAPNSAAGSTKSSAHAPKHFNANLPVLLNVLAKAQGNNYLLKLGNTTIQTQAHAPLQVGKSYWANMQKNAAGQIIISNLVQKPEIDSALKNMPLKLGMGDLRHLASDPKAFVQELKEFLLSQLANTASSSDFKELSLLALSLSQGVLSLVVHEDGHDHLMQISHKSARNKLEFYAIFPRLGPISGQIWQEISKQETPKQVMPTAMQAGILQKQGAARAGVSRICAHLSVMNDRVKELLLEHELELGLSLQISSDRAPRELFSFHSHSLQSLLDLRT